MARLRQEQRQALTLRDTLRVERIRRECPEWLPVYAEQLGYRDVDGLLAAVGAFRAEQPKPQGVANAGGD